MTRTESPGHRIEMLDVARFLGMVLVYYGHVAEQFMYLGDTAAGACYKFIYSFHMPFFFILAGYVHNPAKLRLGPRAFLARLAASRLVPYAAFSLLMLVSTLFFTGWFPAGTDLARGLVLTLRGLPAFNIPTWFMALLVSTEILHYLVGRHLDTGAKLAAAAVLFYLGGWWLNLEVNFFLREDHTSWNFWFVNEAPTMYAFFLVGLLMRGRAFLQAPARRSVVLAAALACLATVFLTYDLNQGPFRLIPAVVVIAGGHGHVFWFPFTAVVGSVLLLLLAKAWSHCAWSARLGRDTIVLFCLNGVFYHYVNPRFAKWCLGAMEPAWWSTTLACAGLTVVSLGLCVPVVIFFTRRLPQLVGRPTVQGPILPRFLKG